MKFLKAKQLFRRQVEKFSSEPSRIVFPAGRTVPAAKTADSRFRGRLTWAPQTASADDDC